VSENVAGEGLMQSEDKSSMIILENGFSENLAGEWLMQSEDKYSIIIQENGLSAAFQHFVFNISHVVVKWASNEFWFPQLLLLVEIG
jgi:hypothetical protein